MKLKENQRQSNWSSTHITHIEKIIFLNERILEKRIEFIKFSFTITNIPFNLWKKVENETD